MYQRPISEGGTPGVQNHHKRERTQQNGVFGAGHVGGGLVGTSRLEAESGRRHGMRTKSDRLMKEALLVYRILIHEKEGGKILTGNNFAGQQWWHIHYC